MCNDQIDIEKDATELSEPCETLIYTCYQSVFYLSQAAYILVRLREGLLTRASEWDIKAAFPFWASRTTRLEPKWIWSFGS